MEFVILSFVFSKFKGFPLGYNCLEPVKVEFFFL